MANWVHVENNEITGYYDLLPKNWRNVSGLNLAKDDLPFLKSLGWYPVTKGNVNLVHGDYVINDYEYEIRENDVLEKPIASPIVLEPQKSFEELKNDFLFILREERNKKLFECDWTQLVDVQNTFEEATKNKWLTYRQALRDLPQIYLENEIISIDDVIWPSVEN